MDLASHDGSQCSNHCYACESVDEIIYAAQTTNIGLLTYILMMLNSFFLLQLQEIGLCSYPSYLYWRDPVPTKNENPTIGHFPYHFYDVDTIILQPLFSMM